MPLTPCLIAFARMTGRLERLKEQAKKLVHFKEPSRSEIEALVEDQPQSTQAQRQNLRTGNALFKTLTRPSD